MNGLPGRLHPLAEVHGEPYPASVPWRNGWDSYTQTVRIDDVPEKLRRLLEKYGEAFDDDWWFFMCNRGKGKGLFARRVPIWQTSKRMPAEKYHPWPRHRGQTALG